MAAATGAILGAAVTGIGAVMSFTQAAEQQKNIQKAQEAAAKFMSEARKKVEVNYFDQLAVRKEPYELQREALLSQGAQAIQAAAEGDRNVAATAGRVQMAQNEAQGQIRSEMGKEISNIEMLKAQEESRLRDINVQLDLGEVEGAQRAEANAEEARSRAMTQGFQGLSNMAMNVAQLVPLYMQSGGTKAFNKSEAQYNDLISQGKLPQFMQNGKPMSYQQAVSTVTNNPNLAMLNAMKFQDYMIGRGSNYLNNIDFMGYQGQPQNQSYQNTTGFPVMQEQSFPGSGVLQNPQRPWGN